MTPVAQQESDITVVAGRSFARMSPEGVLDGEAERGIFAEDLRLLRRVEVFRAAREVPVPGLVAIDAHGCAIRFRLDAVEPGTGMLLVVEFDGTDLFEIRDLLLESNADGNGFGSGLGLGSARPDARVRIGVECEGATLVDSDGVALADAPVRIDGTPRTASWRWTAPSGADEPVDVYVEFRASWALSSDTQPPALRDHQSVLAARRDVVDPWRAARPVVGGNSAIESVVHGTLDDLASLRIQVADGAVLAGGVPWFLTVFGRDAILSAWMALPIDPELAVATLRHLARTQATGYDLATDAEPGKILHEERTGVAALRWHERYYGSVDSTPLFVMLLAEYTRWSGDDSVARELEASARSAIGWIVSRIEEDELGLLSYWRRADRGLDIQSWKDSPDSQRDSVGRVSSGLLRPIEAQGYAVAALRGAARLASTVWDDEVVASEWSAAARLLERRLVEHALVEVPAARMQSGDPRDGGFLAQAVDSEGRAVDSLCSNPGHLLWTDSIADPSLRTRVVEQLTSEQLDSGWGIRTMSTLDDGYDPTSYHCGSVWPHDTALCIAGIARYDRPRAIELAHNLLQAAIATGGRLPEVFSGETRTGDEPPRAIASACSPQAWAAAAPLLVLRSILGLEPDANGNALVGATNPLPDWTVGLTWRGIHALGSRWDVEVGRDGIVEVERR